MSSNPDNNWYRGKQMKTFSIACATYDIPTSLEDPTISGVKLEFETTQSDYSVCKFKIINPDGSAYWISFDRNGYLKEQGFETPQQEAAEEAIENEEGEAVADESNENVLETTA